MDYYDTVPLGRSFRLAEPKDFNWPGPRLSFGRGKTFHSAETCFTLGRPGTWPRA